MQVIVRCIHMQQEPKVAIRIWVVQRGAQHQNSPCRGCKWYAGPSTYHRGYPSWLQRSYSLDWGHIGRNTIGWSWIWYQPNHSLCCWYWDEYCYSSQAKSQTVAGVRPLFVSASPFGGKRFFTPKALAGYCHTICPKYSIFSRCSADSLHCYLVFSFSLNLCKHYLDSAFPVCMPYTFAIWFFISTIVLCCSSTFPQIATGIFKWIVCTDM